MNPIGQFVVLADYSATDLKTLQRVVTRYIPDQSNAESYARLEASELQERPRYIGKKVYVMQIVEVITIEPERH